jgi:hypothetical protein
MGHSLAIRATQVVNQRVTADYTYNALGQRVKKVLYGTINGDGIGNLCDHPAGC